MTHNKTVKGDPFGETRILNVIQGALADRPGVLPAARGLSLAGEHAAAWLALGAAGAYVNRKDPSRRSGWIKLFAAAFVSHALSVVIKRIVRRPRPHDPSIKVGVKTPSKLSFPSSHATSTTAAMVALTRVTGCKAPLALVPVMMLSRMVVGVHYPTDVATGAALGAATSVVIDKVF